MKKLDSAQDWIDICEHQKLGEILMQAGKLNLIHLGMALDIQKFKDMSLGQILVSMKVINDNDVESALEIQEFIDKNNEGKD